MKSIHVSTLITSFALLALIGCGGSSDEPQLGPKEFASATTQPSVSVNFNGDTSAFAATSGQYELLNDEHVITGVNGNRSIVLKLYTPHLIEGQAFPTSGNGGGLYDYVEGGNSWRASQTSVFVASGSNNSAVFTLSGNLLGQNGDAEGYINLSSQTVVSNWPVLPGRGASAGIIYTTPLDGDATLIGNASSTTFSIGAGPSFDFVATSGNFELNINFTNGSPDSSYRLVAPTYHNVTASVTDTETEQTYVANGGSVSYRQLDSTTLQMTFTNLTFDGGPFTSPISGILGATGNASL